MRIKMLTYATQVVNYRLKIRWNDNQENLFDTFQYLRDLLERNC